MMWHLEFLLKAVRRAEREDTSSEVCFRNFFPQSTGPESRQDETS